MPVLFYFGIKRMSGWQQKGGFNGGGGSKGGRGRFNKSSGGRSHTGYHHQGQSQHQQQQQQQLEKAVYEPCRFHIHNECRHGTNCRYINPATLFGRTSTKEISLLFLEMYTF
jgi:hypothetical protein